MWNAIGDQRFSSDGTYSGLLPMDGAADVADTAMSNGKTGFLIEPKCSQLLCHPNVASRACDIRREYKTCQQDSTMLALCQHQSSLITDKRTESAVRPMGCGYVIGNHRTDRPAYKSHFMTIQFCVEICKGLGKGLAILKFNLCYCIDNQGQLVLVPPK